MTPDHILRAVLETAETTLQAGDSRGKVVVVSDGFLPDALGGMLVPTEEALALIRRHEDAPNEALDQVRNTLPPKVAVIWWVGEHFGCVAYERSFLN